LDFAIYFSFYVVTILYKIIPNLSTVKKTNKERFY